ncbi:hypothetical protein [Ochrobactrum sp. AP1BH01-1]|uniref:hypothetical protein n=1 Tax=Ochrobactrum sp. AP1BH01-1 TaxID=2823874 RepID=UPI002570CAEC|nr:hypothetical protein [Ochrobactrum sp. AP1BH01-1]
MGRQHGRQEKPEENQPHQNARLHDGGSHGAIQCTDQKAASQKQGDKLVERTGIGGLGSNTGHGTNIRVGIGPYPHEQKHA